MHLLLVLDFIPASWLRVTSLLTDQEVFGYIPTLPRDFSLEENYPTVGTDWVFQYHLSICSLLLYSAVTQGWPSNTVGDTTCGTKKVKKILTS